MSELVFTNQNSLSGSFALGPLQKLVYSNSTQSPLTNLLLVSTEVQEYQQFIDSANATTFAVAYSRMSSKTELMELLKSKTQSLERIGFVFHSPGNNEKPFLDGKSLFLANELVNDSGDYSENLQWLLDVISKFGVKNADFLACNTLNNDLWKNYYGFLTEKTGIIVGASNDKTGNLKYGGDWIMESTGEDIEKVYFTESIEYYKYLLATVVIDGVTYAQIDTSLTATVSGSDNTQIPQNLTLQSNVTIDGVSGYTVVSISAYALASLTNLQSVIIPTSITIVGNLAFRQTSLTSVTFLSPSQVTSIGENAFQLCTELTTINIPDSVTRILGRAFQQCTKLASVNFGSSSACVEIANYAFQLCSPLTSFTIPASVTTIGDFNPFLNCISLPYITVDPANFYYYNDPQGVVLSRGVTQRLISYPNSTNTSYAIPDAVTTIGEYAFGFLTNLNTVTFGSSSQLVNINQSAFSDCTTLVSIVLPNSLTTIQANAFRYCAQFQSVTFGNSIATIGDSSFSNTLLTSVTIPSSVTSISSNAFRTNASLISVTFNDSSGTTLPSIGGSAFNSISPSSTAYYYNGVYIYNTTNPATPAYFQGLGFANASPIKTSTYEGVTYAQIGTSLTATVSSADNATIPPSLTLLSSVTIDGVSGYTVISISASAFNSRTNLTSITIPSTVTSIDAYAFLDCSNLITASIPSSVITIGDGAFGGSGLTTVTIPSSVETIGTYAFYDCTSLTIVDFSTPSGSNLPVMTSTSFGITAGPFGTAYYNAGARSSNGTTITDYTTYFQGFGFAGASPNEAPCFKEDTKILTDKGYLCIRDLRKGDLVKTLNHDYLPIAMIGKRDLYHHAKKERIKDQLYKCTKEEYPEILEDLIITGGHSILIDDYFSKEQKERSLEFIHAVDELIDNKIRLLALIDERASVYDKPGSYTIYHLALENDDDNMNYGIYANGLLVEACSKNYLKEHSNMILID